MICKVCKKWFRPKKENMYIATEEQSFAEAMLRPPTTYDAVDCPRCGRQHVVGVRMPTKEG